MCVMWPQREGYRSETVSVATHSCELRIEGTADYPIHNHHHSHSLGRWTAEPGDGRWGEKVPPTGACRTRTVVVSLRSRVNGRTAPRGTNCMQFFLCLHQPNPIMFRTLPVTNHAYHCRRLLTLACSAFVLYFPPLHCSPSSALHHSSSVHPLSVVKQSNKHLPSLDRCCKHTSRTCSLNQERRKKFILFSNQTIAVSTTILLHFIT